MARLPTNQRDQLMLAVGILAIVGAAAYWYFVDDPQNNGPDGLVKTTQHIDSLNAINQRVRAQLARGNTVKIKAESDSLRTNLDLLRTLVPASNEVNALIDDVSNAARRVGSDLAGLDPQPPIEGEMFDTYRYQIKLNGAYHDIARVLTNIASLNRVVAPINLSLQPAPANAKTPPGTQPLAATFGIQTYVIRTTPGKPAAPKAGGD
ncbi:MAG: type 4a pilus biogenesis protein PilO [Gemmatimonadota bacterium]|nr:type 4a pilus biogenesis protein PilO [Gemmatimonadota bacterium]